MSFSVWEKTMCMGQCNIPSLRENTLVFMYCENGSGLKNVTPNCPEFVCESSGCGGEQGEECRVN